MIQWKEMNFAYPASQKGVIMGRTHTHVVELVPSSRIESIHYTNLIKFDYYKVKVRKIGEITANFIAVLFIRGLSRVTRNGREYDVVEEGTETMFTTHASNLMSSFNNHRIHQLKFYDSLDRKELYEDVEEVLIELGYIHGLRKLNTLGD